MVSSEDLNFEDLLNVISAMHHNKKTVYCPSGDELESLRQSAQDRGNKVSLEVNGEVFKKARRIRNMVINNQATNFSETALDSALDNAVYSLLTVFALLEEMPDEEREDSIDHLLRLSKSTYESTM